jgi:hypothetical protein
VVNIIPQNEAHLLLSKKPIAAALAATPARKASNTWVKTKINSKILVYVSQFLLK